MPRRREIPKREVPPDPVYGSPLVTKFLSTVMRDGKRSTAELILYRSLTIVKDKTGDDPLKVFKKAVDNTKPSLEVAGWSATPARAATARPWKSSWPSSSWTRPTCGAAR